MAVVLAAVTFWASIPTTPAEEPHIDADYQIVQTEAVNTTVTPVSLVHTTVTAEPEEETSPESRYTGITLSEDDVDLLARIIWLEARGECFEGQQAVAEVVLNRLMSDAFPDTLPGNMGSPLRLQCSPCRGGILCNHRRK